MLSILPISSFIAKSENFAATSVEVRSSAVLMQVISRNIESASVLSEKLSFICFEKSAQKFPTGFSPEN